MDTLMDISADQTAAMLMFECPEPQILLRTIDMVLPCSLRHAARRSRVSDHQDTSQVLYSHPDVGRCYHSTLFREMVTGCVG